MKSSKTTRRALLGSLTSLVLCFAMLIGSTFAWFTDTASTSVNKIQAGTLDVEIVGEDGTTPLKTLSFKDANNGTNILWEPGATFRTEGFQIKSVGNLALKYKIAINGIDGDAKLLEAIDFSIVTGESYEAVNLDTFEGHLTSTNTNSATHYLQGQMKEEAGNIYQGLSLTGITVTVYATQDTVESDSNNNEYDKNATFPTGSQWDGNSTEAPAEDAQGVLHITTAAQFMALMNSFNDGEADTWRGAYYDKTIVLDSDIDLGGATIEREIPSFFYGKFDGQNHTVSNFTLKRTTNSTETSTGFEGYYTALFGTLNGEGSIKNLTVKNATVEGNKSVAGIVGTIWGGTVENCRVEDSTFIGIDQVGAVVGYNSNDTVKDCSATNCTVLYTRTEGSLNEDSTGDTVGIIGDNDATATGNTKSNVSVSKATLVSTAAELKSALDNSNNGVTVYAILTKDIDMSGWTALNGGTNHADIVLLGNGHALKNQTHPLFSAFPGKNFTVSDVTVSGANINYSSEGSEAGAFIGEMRCNGGGTYSFTNCHVKNSSIKAHKYAGAFVGYASNGAEGINFTNCTVTNTSVETADSSAGGFIGHTISKTTLTN